MHSMIQSIRRLITFKSELTKICFTRNMSQTSEVLGKKLVWVDCEMTGLDVSKDRLLEVAVVVTDGNLETVRQLGPYVIQTERSVLDAMDEWCQRTHTSSGLVQQCLDSQLTVEEVDKKLFECMNELKISNALLAGNSVSYDRIFLNKYCPKFAKCLHYRTIDVSSVKELVRIWYKKDESFKKALTHRAIDDINESIAELKFYRKNYFISKK